MSGEGKKRRWFSSTVPFVLRRELNELEGDLFDRSVDDPRVRDALRVLKSGMVNPAVPVHLRCGDLVVELVAQQRLGYDAGVDMLLNVAGVAGSDQLMQSVVHTLGTVVVHAVLNESSPSRPALGGIESAPRFRHPFLRVLQVVPSSWPVLLREISAMLSQASTPKDQLEVFHSVDRVLVDFLVSTDAGIAAGAMKEVCALAVGAVSTAVQQAVVRFLVGILPCVHGSSAASAQLIIDASAAVMDSNPDAYLLSLLLHQLVGLLADEDADGWPTNAVDRVARIMLGIIRKLSTAVPSQVLTGLGWCIFARPSEQTGVVLQVLRAALDTVHADSGRTLGLAHVFFPIAKLIADCEQSGRVGDVHVTDLVAILARVEAASVDGQLQKRTSPTEEEEPAFVGGPMYCQIGFWTHGGRAWGTHHDGCGDVLPPPFRASDDSDPSVTFHMAAMIASTVDGAAESDASAAMFSESLALFARVASKSASDATGALGFICHLLRRPALTAATKQLVLEAVSQLAATVPDAIQPVVEFLLALGADPGLVASSLTHIARVWAVHDRMFPALQRLLCATSINRSRWPLDAHVARAHVLREICRYNPERRGVEVVAGIADVLVQLNNIDGVAMGIESLDALCEAGAVNALSTWSKVQPFVSISTAPRIQTALCRFLRHFQTASVDTADAPIDEDTEGFPAHRALCLAFLWKIVAGADDVGSRAAALASLAEFHPQALVPPTLNVISTPRGVFIPAVDFKPAPLGNIIAMLTESGSGEQLDACAKLAGRLIRHEIAQLSRATRVAWKRGQVGGTTHRSPGGVTAVDQERSIEKALRSAVEVCKQTQRRRALTTGLLLLPIPTEKYRSIDAIQHQLADNLRTSSGWELGLQTRAAAHRTWDTQMRALINGALHLVDARIACTALAETCAACYTECSSTNPVAAASAILATGALAVAIPMHDSLFRWLEMVYGDLMTLLAVDELPGSRASTIFPRPPHGASAECASSAAIALGLVTEAMQRFGPTATAHTDAAAVLFVDISIRQKHNTPRDFGCAVGWALLVAAAVSSGSWSDRDDRIIQATMSLRAAVYPEGPIAGQRGTHHGRGAAVGLGLLAKFLSHADRGSAISEFWTQVVNVDLQATVIALTCGADEAAVVHLSLWAECAAPELVDGVFETILAALKNGRCGGASGSAFAAGAAAVLAPQSCDLATLCRVLTTMASAGDTKVRDAGVLGICMVVTRVDTTQDCVRKVIGLLCERLGDTRDTPATAAAVSLALGRVATTVVIANVVEPRSVDYLPDESPLRAVFGVLANTSGTEESRQAALVAIDLAFGDDGNTSLPPVDWSGFLPNPRRIDPLTNERLETALAFALKRHTVSSSLQRYLCQFIRRDVIVTLPHAMRVCMVQQLLTITKLVAVDDVAMLFELCLVPPLLSSAEPSTIEHRAYAEAFKVGVQHVFDLYPRNEEVRIAVHRAVGKLQELPTSGATIALAKNLADMLFATPPEAVQHFIETKLNGSDNAGVVTASIALSAVFQARVHVGNGLSALHQVSTAAAHSGGEHAILLICLHILRSPDPIVTERVVSVLVDFVGTLAPSSDRAKQDTAAAIATSLALLLSDKYDHRLLICRWLEVATVQQPSTALRWLSMLLPAALSSSCIHHVPEGRRGFTKMLLGVFLRVPIRALDARLLQTVVWALSRHPEGRDRVLSRLRVAIE